MRVAVVGAGITGLSAAWLLSRAHDVMLFEADDRIGGHANTVNVHAPDGRCPIDTGFIVYNTACYPNLIALFDHLGVPTAETDMGFAVSLDNGAYEYCGSGLGGLFGQYRNCASPAHWRLVREVFRFFRQARALDPRNIHPEITLGEWLGRRNYSKGFIHAHIVPMGAAIWSTPADQMLAFPFASFVSFFANHGLLQTFNRPAWRTVKGGSREYVLRLIADFAGRIVVNDPVVEIKGDEKGAAVRTRQGNIGLFDAVLIACHADEALKIAGANTGTADALSAFRYSENEAILHSDASQMPRRKRLWSSWNYIGNGAERDGGGSERLSVTYWMNKLQPLGTKTNYFVTLNSVSPIPENSIVQRITYRHPMFDAAALAAQVKLPRLQGRNSLWFAGSYFGFGFHEDGIQAGLAAAEDLSLRVGGEGGRVQRPWTWDQRQSRMPLDERAASTPQG